MMLSETYSTQQDVNIHVYKLQDFTYIINSSRTVQAAMGSCPDSCAVQTGNGSVYTDFHITAHLWTVPKTSLSKTSQKSLTLKKYIPNLEDDIKKAHMCP